MVHDKHMLRHQHPPPQAWLFQRPCQRLLVTSVCIATCNKGEQHTFIFLFWSQVGYNIVHVVRYNVALFSLPGNSLDDDSGHLCDGPTFWVIERTLRMIQTSQGSDFFLRNCGLVW